MTCGRIHYVCSKGGGVNNQRKRELFQSFYHARFKNKNKENDMMNNELKTISDLREAVTAIKPGNNKGKRKLVLEFLGVKFDENDNDILVEVNGHSLKKLNVKIDGWGLIRRNGESLVKVHAGQRGGEQETDGKYVLMLYDERKSTQCFYFADIETFNKNIENSKKDIAYNDDKIQKLKKALEGILTGRISNE